MVWRCATRIEKGKEACAYSSTLNEECVQKVLSEVLCENSIYDNEAIRNNVEKILVFNNCLEIL